MKEAGDALSDNTIISLALGVLIGLVSGLITILVLLDTKPRTGRYSLMERVFGRHQPSAVRSIMKLSTLPVFWLGGPWLSSALMEGLNWIELRPLYMASVAVVYLVVVVVPLVAIILRITK